ncbi:MAG: hypothetical protein GXP37_06110 [Chloroflexi bacterium]|nr:hypothetical protein [Chloroflexota bacterium]
MKHKLITLVFPLVGLLTILVIASLTLGQPSRAQGISVRGQLSPQANVGTAFTYQGRIIFNGAPVNNEICSVQPTLWDAQTGGTQLASSSQTIVNPSNGFFKMDIDFGSNAFTGAERWLQLKVACVSDPNAAQGTVLPRIRLAPTPYALSLVPGAYVQDDSASPGTAFSATSGQTWNLPLFIATKIAGIWGDSRFNDGVIGTSQQGNGVYGYSETGKAVYADGDAHVDGNLTWKAKTSHVSVSPAAFIPNRPPITHLNLGYTLKNGSGSSAWWSAPVQLPHGAVVTSFEACWQDGNTDDARASLVRRPLTDLNESLANLASVNSHGYPNTVISGCDSNTSILTAVIDNDNYAYYIDVSLPPHTANEPMEFYGVSIDYQITEPY